jgi:hypothetical protein
MSELEAAEKTGGEGIDADWVASKKEALKQKHAEDSLKYK